MEHRSLFTFGPFCLNESERILLRDGRLIPLPPKALSTLLVLVRNRGHVVEKDALMTEVWPDEAVEEGNLAQHVFMVRRALGETPDIPKYIETIPRRGYRFLNEAQQIDAAEINFKSVLPSLSSESIQCPLRVHSVAVMPFTNVGTTHAPDPLSEGITESLINFLSRLPQLSVTSSNALVDNDRTSFDYSEIGSRLGVECLLLGRVQVSNERLMIRIKLVHVDTGTELWSSSFRGEFTNIFAIQEKIVKGISTALQLKLEVSQEHQPSKHLPNGSRAHRDYLKGRFYWNKRSEAALKRSIRYFNRAITKDPNCALAHAGVADALGALGFQCILAPEETFPKAKTSAIKALTIDQDLAPARASLGFSILHHDWDWQTAEASFKKAILLDPNYFTGHVFYGWYLISLARFDEAIITYKRALEIEPLSLISNAALGYAYYFARRYDEAIAQCKRTTEMDDHFEPAHLWLGWAYEQKEMWNEAIEQHKQALLLSGYHPSNLAALGTALARSGDIERAEKVLGDLTKMEGHKFVSPYCVASIHTALGRIDEAFKWLYKAYEGRSPLLVSLNIDPKFDRLRSEPRFSILVERIFSGKQHSESTDANRVYVRGRQCWTRQTKEGFEQAIQYFQEAIKLDPSHHAAYEAVVDCYLRLVTRYFLPNDMEHRSATGVAAIESHTSDLQGSFRLQDEWNLAQMARETKHADELKSNVPSLRQWVAVDDMCHRLYDEANREQAEAGETLSNSLMAASERRMPDGILTTGLLPEQEVQLLCLLARRQIEIGNVEAGGLLLQSRYVVGEWPRLESLSPQSSAELLLTAGILAGRLATSRQLPRGQKHSEALISGAISLYEHLGLKTQAAEGKSELGRCYEREGILDLARANFLAALEELAPDDFARRCRTLVRLAFAEMKFGHLHDSLAHLREASGLVTMAGPSTTDFFHTEMATTLGEVAIAEGNEEYFNQACEHYQQALFKSEVVGHLRRIAVLECNHGYLLMAFAKLGEAKGPLLRARKLFDHLSDRCPQLDETLARFYIDTNQFDLAQQAIERSVTILEKGGEEALLAESLRTQGRVFSKMGRPREAKRVLDRAYQVAERCGDDEGAGLALLLMIEEVSGELQNEELSEMETIVTRLLRSSQRASVVERLGKISCFDCDAGFQTEK